MFAVVAFTYCSKVEDDIGLAVLKNMGNEYTLSVITSNVRRHELTNLEGNDCSKFGFVKCRKL